MSGLITIDNAQTITGSLLIASAVILVIGLYWVANRVKPKNITV